jgi:hypothetical protein
MVEVDGWRADRARFIHPSNVRRAPKGGRAERARWRSGKAQDLAF